MRIKVTNLIKKIEDRNILNIPELTIDEGLIVSIFGPNGSGKTTLLNILAGLDEDYIGEVLYNDEKFTDNRRKDITMLFQKGNLLNKTVYDNISYPLKLRGFKDYEIKCRVNDVLNKLKIVNLINARARNLSSGEAQKVAIARALAFEPKLLMLDEPTANLDLASTELVEEILLELNKTTKTTIIMVTHNLEQAQRTANSILYLKDGMVIKKDEIF